MRPIRESYVERLAEIKDYLMLITAVDEATTLGPPRISDAIAISATQRRMLYSSVYLQLYNLVEATITACVDAVCSAARNGSWRPKNLSGALRREWIRHVARTHVDIGEEKRLDAASWMFGILVAETPIQHDFVSKGGGGNWDDEEIARTANRLGVSIQLTPDTLRKVKRPVRDDRGPLQLVKSLRNSLAHGSISFNACSENTTASDLVYLTDLVAEYLAEVVTSFEQFLDGHQFLSDDVRPRSTP